MPASTKDTARDSSIYAGALLSDYLLHKVPYPLKAIREPTTPTRDYIQSSTLSNDKQYKAMVNSAIASIAAGIKADSPNGFQGVEIGYPELADRFPGHAVSRAQVLGIFVVALAHPVADGKMQLTLLVRTTEWQSPK